MRKSDIRWAVRVVVSSIVLATVFTLLSTAALAEAGYLISFLVLAIFILVGILFDMIGVAVTAADEKPFHSMAAHKSPGGKEGICLVKNADRVSSLCNDVVGDITGIISGTTMAVLAARLAVDFRLSSLLVNLVISGLVIGFTIGGKALAKGAAIRSSTGIVLFVALIIYRLRWVLTKLTRRKP
ncbi:MAG: hypothetical protein FWC72_04895 [Oscillospiraceae bacterium]|nr:hypothetical protein [Oscillospiraceae bacterium]